VALRWLESGGPAVEEPERSGFGRFVTETMVRASLNATVTIEFRSEGLVWEAVFPLDEANERAGS
jgi:two-component sensor histidine kinase